MFQTIVKLYLRHTGKQHLVAFVEGLANIGRPSPTLFPGELLEQGLGIVLSGLNNALAIQTNPDWVWPHWVERQMRPGGGRVHADRVNLVTANIALRNWTSLGLEASDRESMVDPVGMLPWSPSAGRSSRTSAGRVRRTFRRALELLLASRSRMTRSLVSVDFFTVPTATFQVLFVLVVFSHQRRRVLHFNVTRNLTVLWTAQQMIEAFPEDTAPRYLTTSTGKPFATALKQ